MVDQQSAPVGEVPARRHPDHSRNPTVIALIAAYNEEDIIAQVVADLIRQGISVYLLDHGSSDATVAWVEPWLGRGLLGVEPFEPEQAEFSLARIVRRKQELAEELEADWFINHDADELRDSPWSGTNLSEAIALVDRLGYNAIDFEVFEHWPTSDHYRTGDDLRTTFPYFSPSGSFNKLQIRCWKRCQEPGALDLVSSAGHEAVFPGRRVFPIRFILRHYPFRSQAHGERKLLQERRPRYSAAERSGSWHVQYDSLGATPGFVRDPAELIRFDIDSVRVELQINHRQLELVSGDSEALDLAAAGDSRERELLSRQLDAQNRRVEQLSTELDQRNRRIEQLSTELDQHNRRIEQLSTELDQHRHRAEQLGTELATVETKLAAKETKLAAKETKLAAKETELVAMATELATIRRSLSWRLTAPLRAGLRWFRGY